MTLKDKALKEIPLNKYVHMLKPCWAGVWEQERVRVYTEWANHLSGQTDSAASRISSPPPSQEIPSLTHLSEAPPRFQSGGV